MLQSKREKEKLVVKIAKEGKTTMEIAKEVRISLKIIGQILNKTPGTMKPKENKDLNPSPIMPKSSMYYEMVTSSRRSQLNWTFKAPL